MTDTETREPVFSAEDYIRERRLDGSSDDMIRATMRTAGWNDEQITTAFVGTTDRNSADVEGAWCFLRFGFGLFLVTSALLFFVSYSQGESYMMLLGDEVFYVLYALFSVTHVLNGIAAFFAFRAIWCLRTFLYYRILVGILGAIVASFGAFSFAHLAPAAVGMENYSSRLFFDEGGQLIITYWILLPLQAVVYVLLLALLGELYARRHRSSMVVPAKKLFVVLWVFLLMALLAFGDMIMGMDVLV